MQNNTNNQKLSNKKIAILVADGFEEVQLKEPMKMIEVSDGDAFIVSLQESVVKGWDQNEWSQEFPVDVPISRAMAESFDALLVPGGVLSVEKLRHDKKAVQFVRSFFKAKKPIAAIAHAPWMLIEAGAVKGRKLTSIESIQTDLKNAGAQWLNQEVVVDRGIVTSRKQSDLLVFSREMAKEFAKGIPEPEIVMV